MCEWLKQSVLKTDVRETVPGVRIPLPPPRSLDCREFPPSFPKKTANYANFSRFLVDKSDCRERTALGSSRHSSGVFLWSRDAQSGLQRAAKRTFGNCDSTADLTFVAERAPSFVFFNDDGSMGRPGSQLPCKAHP
jgi:hypothetical protein